MADFGFVGPSYEAPSIYQDAQECINFYPELDPLKQPGERGVAALYPTPGLTSLLLFQNQQEIRGMVTLSGGDIMVVVCGPYVYAITSSYNTTMVGQLNTNTGRVGITDNGINVYIVDGVNRYTWRISSPSSTKLTRFLSTRLEPRSSSLALQLAMQTAGLPSSQRSLTRFSRSSTTR